MTSSEHNVYFSFLPNKSANLLMSTFLLSSSVVEPTLSLTKLVVFSLNLANKSTDSFFSISATPISIPFILAKCLTSSLIAASSICSFLRAASL